MNTDLNRYLEMLHQKTPFLSLLYGDGEFMVASRSKTGKVLQCGEVITTGLEDAMRASLTVVSDRIIRGTDLHLLDTSGYRGNDLPSLKAISEMVWMTIDSVMAGAGKSRHDLTWVDGVVWENSVRNGQLGSLLAVLRSRQVILVSNQELKQGLEVNRALLPCQWVKIPTKNAWRHHNGISAEALSIGRVYHDPVYVLCMGLGAIPLAMELYREIVDVTVLDLGSVLDIFAGLGKERGWRNELYQDPAKHWKLIEDNLKEVRTLEQLLP